jgi:chromosome segregation ATPase
MSQSIDYRKLEIVSQFAGLLEILAKPDDIKALISDAKTIIADKKALLGPLTEKANLDALIDREEAELAKKKEQMEVLLGQAQDEARRIVDQAKVKLAEVEKQTLEAKLMRAESEDTLKRARDQERLVEKRKEEVEAASKVLTAKQAEYEAMSAALAEKAAKLQQLFGA